VERQRRTWNDGTHSNGGALLYQAVVEQPNSREGPRRQAEEMANPFVKAWKYLMAAFSSKIDEHADPKVQIQQAIEEAQRQHQALSQQAAAVIGNQRQLEMKLNRQLGEVEKLQSSARQALVLSDEARGKGDEQKATQFEQAASAFAAQLVTAEQSIEDLKSLHDQALQAASQAKTAVERNAMVLQNKLAERTKLLSQLEQAKMQEQVSRSLNQMSELAAPGNVPSLEEVRDKIEKRYATAIGSAELAGNSVQGRMLEVQASTTEMAGQSRLEQIRASLHGGSVAPQVTAGTSAGSSAPAATSIQAEIAQRVAQEQKANPQGGS
jgi:phage shock protein A